MINFGELICANLLVINTLVTFDNGQMKNNSTNLRQAKRVKAT